MLIFELLEFGFVKKSKAFTLDFSDSNGGCEDSKWPLVVEYCFGIELIVETGVLSVLFGEEAAKNAPASSLV